LELGGIFSLTDIVTYCHRYGYKVPTMTAVFIDGALAQSDPYGADGEVCLDIDVIAAVAQGCQIVVVFAPNTDQGFIDGVKECLDTHPDAISISWGAPENTWSQQARDQLDHLFQTANDQGIPVFVAAGDNGSSDGEPGKHCDYPASSPYVVSCGGTHLEIDAEGHRVTETAWSNGGGGLSSVYAPPAYQSRLGLDHRAVPDLAGNADPATGYQVDIDGDLQQIGGTSAVAPLMAAYYVILKAQAHKDLGHLHDVIYQHEACFFDVVRGSNGAYEAKPGYDCVTGVGVIDGTRFIAEV